MPLSDEQRQALREEEFFRSEVRKQLAGAKPPPGLLERISAFLETKAGFWLLTTALAGIAATGFTSLQRFLDREEIAQRESAERARRDMDTVLKLGPMLTSDKRTQVDVAIVLLDGLASDRALDGRVANQVKALVQSALATGLKTDANAEEKGQAQAIIAYADRARVMAIQAPEAAQALASTQTLVSNAIDSPLLPVRVYLQISSEAERPQAEAAAANLRKAGLVAPGIERVDTRRAPRHNDLRYCAGKVDPNALERVKAAAATAMTPAPVVLPLAESLCAKVRYNHFELWYAKPGG